MANNTNNIQFRSVYEPLVDEAYCGASKTTVLENDAMFMEAAGQIFVKKISTDGLGDFVREVGAGSSTVTLEWEPIKYDKERGTSLPVDREDEDEANGVFLQAAAQFMREHAAPEIDAARFAKICSADGITKKAETLVTGEDVVKSLRACATAMNNASVPKDSRVLFISVAANGAIEDLDAQKSQKVLKHFGEIIEVEENRFYSAIQQFDGTDKRGWAPAEGAVGINFIAVDKNAIAATRKVHVKQFTPDQDQTGADNYRFTYRVKPVYAHIYDNKKAGVYVSVQEA